MSAKKDPMKMGEQFDVSLGDLVLPWIGHLMTITFSDQEPVKARLISVSGQFGTLKVVPEGTKE